MHNEDDDKLSVSQVRGSRLALIAAEMPLSCGEMIWFLVNVSLDINERE
jgi:hypothetical protein